MESVELCGPRPGCHPSIVKITMDTGLTIEKAYVTGKFGRSNELGHWFEVTQGRPFYTVVPWEQVVDIEEID